MKKENNKKSILGFSIGDVNGIGPEILIKSLSNKKLIDLFTPIIFCNPEIIDYYCKLFKKKINYNLIHSINNISSNRINIIKVSNENVEINPGKIKRKTGNHAFKSLEITTDHLIKNEISIYEIITGAALAFAAFLLILPGFLTDIVGFLLIIPITRKFFIRSITSKYSKKKINEDIIEGSFEENEPKDKEKNKLDEL